MWLPNQVPALADKLKQAGLALDPATLADLNAAPSIVKAVVGNDAARIKCASILKGPDNYKKKLLGEIAEKDFRDWIASDAARAKQYSEALEWRDALIIETNDAQIDNLRLAQSIGRSFFQRRGLRTAGQKSVRSLMQSANLAFTILTDCNLSNSSRKLSGALIRRLIAKSGPKSVMRR